MTGTGLLTAGTTSFQAVSQQTTDSWGDPEIVPSLIANHIVTTANDYASAQKLPAITVTKEDLTAAISESTPNTQIIGAALLQVTFADPGSKIYRSGICNMNGDGMLYQVDVNFPEGTPVWWRLAAFNYQSVDSSQGSPNLTLTFRHRIVSYLSDCWGPLGWPSGHVGQTRAQFLKMLVTKMPSELPKQSIGPGAAPGDFSFICPEINELQPVSNASGTGIIGTAGGNNTVLVSGSAKKRSDKINKQSAVTAGSKITVLGEKPSADQIANINTILGVGALLNAPVNAMIASIYAAMGESGIHINTTPGNNGVFETTGSPTAYSGGSDLAAQAKGWFTGGESFANGGGIALANAGHPVWQIANAVELNGVYLRSTGSPGSPGYGGPNGTGDSYAIGDMSSIGGQAGGLAEATAIVAAFNGGNLPAGSGTGSTTTGGNTGESDVAQLTRGQSDNPDEDSWTCMQRLASEVNWALFTTPSPAPGVWGNYIYFADLPTIVASKPSLYLALSEDGTTWSATDPDSGKTVAAQGVVNTLSVTADNSAMSQQVTRTVKGKLRKKITGNVVSAPQTPTQIMFNMLCGWLEFNAGDVFVFHDAGGANGRWIVQDVTCNMLGDLFSQFTLGPPTFPYPEPQAVTTATAGAKGNSGGVSVADVALDVSGYTNPLAKIANLQPRRVDQGVDYSGSGPLLALGNGTVTCDSGAGWPGGGGVVIKLSDGPYAGKYVYYMEDITATVSRGDKVTAGQQVATLHDAYPNLEIGWGSGNNNQPLAQALGQNGQETGQSSDPGGVQSAAGINFNKLLVALGAPSGGPGSGPLSTGPGMPSNWPTLTAAATKKAQQTNNVLTDPGSFPLPSTTGPATGIVSGVSGIAKTASGGFSGLFG
jgi:hypothetical protein